MWCVISPNDEILQWNTKIPLENDLMLLDNGTNGNILYDMVILFGLGDCLGKEMVDIDSKDLNLFVDLNRTVILCLLLLHICFSTIVDTDKSSVVGVAIYG